MSGGNQQKLLIAREVDGDPALLVAAYPVRGLDIGAAEAIREILIEESARGTAVLLISEELEEIFTYIYKVYKVIPDAEITLEANPDDLTPAYVAMLRTLPVNRISMGIQTFQEETLKLLHRRHTAQQAIEAFRRCREAGFQNISIDLMYGLPGETLETWKQDLQQAIDLHPEHISAYLLKVEPGTPYARAHMEERIPDDDGMAERYLAVCERLEQQGYRQYEISNFAREGKISRHNTGYWLGTDYLGLGPAAHSLWQGQRYCFPRNLQGFLQAQDPFALWQQDGEGGTREEFIMLRLRLTEGLALEELDRRWPESAAENLALRRRLPPLERAGLVRLENGRLSLTREGFLVSNGILAQLI